MAQEPTSCTVTEDLSRSMNSQVHPPKSISAPIETMNSFLQRNSTDAIEQDEGVDDVDTTEDDFSEPAAFGNFASLRSSQSSFSSIASQQQVKYWPKALAEENLHLRKSVDTKDKEIQRLKTVLQKKDDRISDLEIVNEQLKVYTETCYHKHQELQETRARLRIEVQRSSRLEQELDFLRRRIRELAPQSQRLVDHLEGLVSNSELPLHSSNMGYTAVKTDCQYEWDWDPWAHGQFGSSSQLTGRTPGSNGKMTEDSVPSDART